jgi:soluble lytic murein transglycosylase
MRKEIGQYLFSMIGFMAIFNSPTILFAQNFANNNEAISIKNKNIPNTQNNNIKRQINSNVTFKNGIKAARALDLKGAINAIESLENQQQKAIIGREIIFANPNIEADFIKNWLVQYYNLNGAQTIYEIAQRRKIINLTQPINYETPRKFGKLKTPKENEFAKDPNAIEINIAILNQIATLFRNNNDKTAIELALGNLNNAYSGQIAWFGGLASYRSGDFENAFVLFSMAANWQYGDDYLKSGAAFWAARSAKIIQKPDEAKYYLQKAANTPLSFYGQIALMQLGLWDNLPIPSVNDENKAMQKLLNNDENVKIAINLLEIGETQLANDELEFAWKKSNNGNDIAFSKLAGILGFEKLAKIIAQNNDFSSLGQNYPIVDITPNGNAFVLDRALIYAIMRQESRFDSNAISYAGARGLMQIMPATAAWLMGQPQIRNNPQILHNQKLNLTLGENYLEYVLSLNVTDGSVARALMAYNAGPGNVNKWQNRTQNSDDTLMFIEATANKQAREYVKKVMTNLWIYHKRLGQKAPTLEKLADNQAPIYEPQDDPRKIYYQNQKIASNSK